MKIEHDRLEIIVEKMNDDIYHVYAHDKGIDGTVYINKKMSEKQIMIMLENVNNIAFRRSRDRVIVEA